MGTFSIWHWLVVLAIVILVFGTKKLRNLGGDLGSAIKSFKEGMKESEDEKMTTPPPQVKGQTIDGEAKKTTPTKETKEKINPKT